MPTPTPGDRTAGDPWTPAEPVREQRPPQYVRPSWLSRHRGGLAAFVSVLVVVGLTVGALLYVRHDGEVADPAAADALLSSAAPSPSPTATPSASTPAAPPESTADGKVTAESGGSWQLEVEKGLTLTVVVGATTTFDHGKSAAQVKVGDQVEVKGTLASGVITATSVSEQKPSSDKSSSRK